MSYKPDTIDTKKALGDTRAKRERDKHTPKRKVCAGYQQAQIFLSAPADIMLFPIQKRLTRVVGFRKGLCALGSFFRIGFLVGFPLLALRFHEVK